jgi:hypothetical protein
LVDPETTLPSRHYYAAPAVKGNPLSSHKFAGKCALRYELGVDIIDGNLVWLEVPFPAGKFTDIPIFFF